MRDYTTSKLFMKKQESKRLKLLELHNEHGRLKSLLAKRRAQAKQLRKNPGNNRDQLAKVIADIEELREKIYCW